MSKNNEVKFKQEKLDGSKIKLEMVLGAEAFDKIIKKVAKHFSENTKLDGFRKGKVPFDLIKKTIGEDKLLQEGAEEAVKQYYVDYVIKEKIEAIGQPELKFKKMAWGNDLEVDIEVAVLPEVELNKNWKEEVAKINKKFDKKEIKVEKKEIERELETLAKQRAKISTVDRPAKKGDQVQVDFEAYKDKVILEGGSAKDHTLIIGEGRFIPGFEDNLIGMKASEVKEFELAFPKDYHAKHLAGQKVTFKVTMKNVQQREVPELNDEFAKGIGKFKSLKEIEKNIEEGLKQEKEKKIKQEQHLKIIEKLIDEVKMEIPKVLIDSEIEKMNMELENQLSQMGLNKETYLQQIGSSAEKLESQWKEKDAPKRVKAALILRKISVDNKIEPQSKDIQDRVNQVIQHYQMMSQGKEIENLDTQRIYANIKSEMTNEMVLDYLMNIK